MALVFCHSPCNRSSRAGSSEASNKPVSTTTTLVPLSDTYLQKKPQLDQKWGDIGNEELTITKSLRDKVDKQVYTLYNLQETFMCSTNFFFAPIH